MIKKTNIIKEVIEYCVFIFSIIIMRLMGIDRASNLCSCIFRFMGPYTKKGFVVRNNLKFIYEDISDKKVKILEKKIWDNFGRYIGEFAFLDAKFLENSARVEIRGLEILKKLQKEGKSFIAFSGHFANWDFMLYEVLKNTGEVGVVYRKINNRFINEYVLRQRSYKGATMINKGPSGMKYILEAVKEKKNILMLVDQKMNEGIKIPLLGKPANTPDGIAKLARQFNYALLPAKIERLNGVNFRLTFLEYFYVENSGTKEADIRECMIKINDMLSKWINERPESWLWTHQRWGKPEEMKISNLQK